MHRKAAPYAALILLTFAAYALVLRNNFVGYDDDYYITENPVVREGLTWHGAKWAFTTFEQANWHPLTWLSHMTDVELFGLNPAGHHVMSLALHILTALLLFSFLARTTGAAGKSFFVAALFAVHPLHVESVAWAAERKDVLSHLFFALMLVAYARYARKPDFGRYALVGALLALGLMAKPMLVSAPLLLLLIDYWPLQRFSLDRAGLANLKRCLLEKIPLAALAGGSAVVTVVAQRSGGAVRTLETVPLTHRVMNAAIAYCTYLVKTFVPTRLAPLYPYPAEVDAMKAVAALLVLTAVTVTVLAAVRKYRFLATGWLWFLISLVPVIGLVQVGSQSHADRYTYLPHTGLFICIAWGVPALIGASRWGRASARPAGEGGGGLSGRILPAAAAAVLFVFAAATAYQVTFWKDSFTLFTRAVSVTQNNAVAHYNLGNACLGLGDYKTAADNFVKTLEYRPDDYEAMTNLGVVLLRVDELDKAASCFEQVLAREPGFEYAAYNLAIARYRQENYEAAAKAARQVVESNPDYAPAKSLLGRSLYHLGRAGEARPLLEEVLEADPENQLARQYLFKITGGA